MRSFFAYAIFLLAISFSAVAQDEDSTIYLEEADYEQYDTIESTYAGDEEYEDYTLTNPQDLESSKAYQQETIKEKNFDRNKWKEVVGDTDYTEAPEEVEEEKKKSSDTLIDPVKPWNMAALQPIAWVLIIGAAIAILYFVLKNTTFEKKIKKSTINIEDEEEHKVEDIESFDADDLIRQAIGQGNYRLAIRLYYLDLLKTLHTRGFIQWKKNKTNLDYLTELFSKEKYFDDVKDLTLAYEQVWYGERSLTRSSFDRLSGNFQTVHSKISQPEAS